VRRTCAAHSLHGTTDPACVGCQIDAAQQAPVLGADRPYLVTERGGMMGPPAAPLLLAALAAQQASGPAAPPAPLPVDPLREAAQRVVSAVRCASPWSCPQAVQCPAGTCKLAKEG